MVTVTEGAAEFLTRIQTGQAVDSTQRVIVEEGEFVIGSTQPAQDDEVCFHQGAPVLRLTAEAAEALKGFTVDTEETPEGPTLAIVPPLEDATAATG
jgi:hypothetical protein